MKMKSQSLFYWIIYSYRVNFMDLKNLIEDVSILILLDYLFLFRLKSTFVFRYEGLNPYFIGLSILIRKVITKDLSQKVSILILLDYLFLFPRVASTVTTIAPGLNPYFIGLSILMK